MQAQALISDSRVTGGGQAAAPEPSQIELLRGLWRHVSGRRRVQFGLLLGLMVASSLTEMVSIGAVLPFLGVLTAPEHVFNHALAQPVVRALGLAAPGDLLLPLALAFGTAALLAGALRLALLWATTRVSFDAGADLSISIYRRTLYQPYAVHVARNSSEVINTISGKAYFTVVSAILPVLTLISAAIMLTMILTGLLLVDATVALAAMAGFGGIYLIIVRLTRRRLLVNSELIARESTQVIKVLQEGLGGIRDVLINGAQPLYCEYYRNADQPLRRAQAVNQFIGQSPRHGMEALGMLLIAGLAYGLAQGPDGLARAIPVLGVIALGAQRLLPVLQQIYGAWSAMRGGQVSLADALDMLAQPLPEHDETAPPLPFRDAIRFRGLGFRYAEGAPQVLKDVELTIAKGSRVGFIGTTGSGKSTLLDILMGLLHPTHGEMTVDGVAVTPANARRWQAHIAHVPQSIYLADSSIAENIAFGEPADRIDLERVHRAARMAQIADIIESWPEGYDTFVGERGVRLSGGQRQRIGIARALYRQADVLVFDEATSALDNDTEAAVMQAVEQLGGELTILIIAHRLGTLRHCDQVVELGAGGVQRVGSYRDIVEQAP
jgi:ATP-binding cassette subfamily B protein